MSTNKAAVRSSSNKKKSLCEKSMKILVNLIKVSSLSLASMSLIRTTTTAPPSTRRRLSANYHDDHHPAAVSTNLFGSTDDDHGGMAASVADDHPSGRRQMSKKAADQINNKSKLPASYLLVDPINVGMNKGSSHMQLVQDHQAAAGKINNVDSEASNYIQRFHEKNRKSLHHT